MCPEVVLLVEGAETHMALEGPLTSVDLDVLLYFGSADELLLAYLTLEGPDVVVAILHMLGERGAGDKVCTTNVALVRLLPGVGPLMVLAGAVLGKSLAAVVALVRPVVGMCPHVGPQIGLTIEFFATHFALSFGLPHVALHVEDEVLLVSQYFVADLTEELIILPVHSTQVELQVLGQLGEEETFHDPPSLPPPEHQLKSNYFFY